MIKKASEGEEWCLVRTHRLHLSKFETADEMFLQRFIYPRYLGAFNIPLVMLIPAPKGL